MNEAALEPTEGEWKYYDCGLDENGERDAFIVSERGYSVARCPRYQTKEQWEADAKLIVQSKKMASLLNTIAHYHAILDETPAGKAYAQDQPYVEDVIAVLKEAGVYNA